MKKAAFPILVCLLALSFSQADAQTLYPRSYSNHAHEHLSYSIDTLVYDPYGTGDVVLEVSMTVDLAGHPECEIAYTYFQVLYETLDFQVMLYDEFSTSLTYTKTVSYNMNDDPYHFDYTFGVVYDDYTEENLGLEAYWW